MKKKKLLRVLLMGILLVGAAMPFKAGAQTDYTSKMSSAKDDWTSASGTWGGGVERYNGNTTAFPVGNVLYQTINDLPNGHYKVAFKAFENYANWDDNANLAVGNKVAEVFANDSKFSIHTIKNTGGRTFDDDSELYTLYAQVTNGTLVYGLRNIVAGGNWAACKPVSLTYLGENLPDNTDLTEFVISNWDFNKHTSNGDFLGWTISAASGSNTNKYGDSSVEYWISTAANGSFDYYQTIKGLPGGKYTISASMWNTNNANGSGSEANGECGVYGTSGGESVFAGVTTDSNGANLSTYTTNSLFVGDGEIRLGVKNNTTMAAQWFGVDWIKLNYVGCCIVNTATAFTSGNSVTANKWYAISIPATGDYVISSTDGVTLTYTQDGTQIASNVTSTDNVPISAGSNEILSLNIGSLFVKSNANTTISIEASSLNFTAGQDITSLITNPGFESNGATVNLSNDNLTGVTGWTLATAEHTNDVGTRAYSNGTFATLNGVGDYCFNCYWEGKPLTQEIGPLPAGTYELSALVTTGNGNSMGTVYLNAGTVHSTGLTRKSANANYYQREKLLFTLTSPQKVTIGIRGGDNPENGESKGAYNENGYWWYKCDDFQLTYLCEATQENLYNKLQTLINNCVPWTSGDDYANKYATYSSYSTSNSIAELTTAIDYLNNEYEKYALTNGNYSHPYELNVIQNPTYDNSTTSWNTALNQTGGGSYSVNSDGTQTNFFHSSYNSHMRHSSVYQEGIILDEGIYRLSAKMKGTPKDDVSTYIYATTGTVDHWGSTLFAGTTYYGYLTTAEASSWSTVEAYLTLDAPNKLRIGVLSWGNNWNGGNGGAFSVDDWTLEKIDYAVVTKNAVVSAYGAAPLANINAALTQDVAAVDLTKATGLSSAAISTSNNANLLIHANSGQVSNSNNVVVDGTCANLVLVDGYPFVNPKEFTATSASYTMSAIASGTNYNSENVSMGTLMLPFAASLPSGGSAYKLDQGVDLMDGNIRGTVVSSIAANSPVLVTKAGTYSGSGTVPVVASGATYTNGELVGTYSPMTAVEGSYVLQNHSNSEGVAFYLVGSTKPTVNPFRAYIKSQGSNARALHVVFDDEAQGITNLNDINDNLNGEVYDLQGRRVAQPTRGLYIVNGRKTVIK